MATQTNGRAGAILEETKGFADRRSLGILLGLGCYGMYTLHYATMKWLGAEFPLWQLAFIRSVVMLVITLAAGGIGPVKDGWNSPYKVSTVFRAVMQVASVACFYSAARSMSLAEVTTLYSAAPLIIVILSIFVLGEKVRGFRWLAVALGFAGTIVATDPTGKISILPAITAFGSGVFWAVTVVFTRKSGARESSSVQLLITGLVFLLVSGCLMTWKSPTTLFEWVLMAILGVQIYLAQYLFFEACRFAPASLVGPLEYSSLIWACLLGFLIFSDVPAPHVVLGGLLVASGGIALVCSVRLRVRPPLSID